MTTRIYMDNAATSFPKPPEVLAAMNDYAKHVGASAGRGAYREAVEAGEMIAETRRLIARMINASDPNHVVMTFNCTDGLSQVIKGLITEPDVHVITTCMDHNSVLRPLESLKQQLGISVTHVPADAEGIVDPDDIRQAIGPKTRLIAGVHGSNVCGSVQDIATIGAIARDHEIPFLVDAAQTAGHYPLDVQKIPLDFLAFPGHKGLLGPLGTGVLYIRPGMENRLQPLREGGTGSKSELPVQPDFMPDRFEAGSHNAIGIAGLHAGVTYILSQTVAAIYDHDQKLCRHFLTCTENLGGIEVFGPKDLGRRVGVFSVRINSYEPGELAAVLEEEFGILTRPGLHCAPLAHRALGTFESGGTTRLSFGPFTTVDEAEKAAHALAQVTQVSAR